jgi:uncharacterized membrane protein YhaH (DUF805 family)
MTVQRLNDERSYWIGILALAFIASVLGSLKDRTFSLIINILLGTFVYLLISMMVGGLTMLIAFLFTKKFSRSRFLKANATTCFIFFFIQLIALIQNR